MKQRVMRWLAGVKPPPPVDRPDIEYQQRKALFDSDCALYDTQKTALITTALRPKRFSDDGAR